VKTDAFVDDDTFIPHFIKCFGKHTEIWPIFPPLYSDDVEFY
jgi:hypothetical protein